MGTEYGRSDLEGGDMADDHWGDRSALLKVEQSSEQLTLAYTSGLRFTSFPNVQRSTLGTLQQRYHHHQRLPRPPQTTRDGLVEN